MKHDAIVEQGIPIHERVPIPEEMIPADSRVEIDAKIQAGYCKLHTREHTTQCTVKSDVMHGTFVQLQADTSYAQSLRGMSCRWMSLPM